MKKNEAQRSMSNDARLAVLETAFISINSTLLDMRRSFDKLDSKIDALDKKFESKLDAIDKKFDSKFDTMDKKFDSKFDILYNRLWSNFLWLMSMIIGLASLIAHTQHWF